MLRLYAYFLLFFTAFSSLIFSFNHLSLDQFLDLLKLKHPYLQQLSYQVQLQDQLVIQARAIDDWSLSLEPSSRYEEPVSNSMFSSRSFSSHGVSLRSQRFLWDRAATFSFDVNFDYVNQDYPLVDFGGEKTSFGRNKAYQHFVGVTYSLPLLKNRKGELSKFPFVYAKQEAKIQGIHLEENEESFKLSMILSYLEWVLLLEQEKIAKERVSIAAAQLKLIQRRVKSNLAERIDLLRAEDALRLAKQDLLQRQLNFESKKAYLSEILQDQRVLAYFPKYDFYDLSKLSLTDLDPTANTLDRLARIKSLTTASFDLQILNKEQSALSELDLILTGGMQAEKESFSKAIFPDKPKGAVFLMYKKLFRNRKLSAELAALSLQKASFLKEYDGYALNKKAEQQALLTQLKTLKSIINLNRAHIRSAQKRYKEETRRYNLGKAELRDVIQARDNQESAKMMLTQQVFSYHQCYYRYLAEMDRLGLL
eukprot:COSAG01_NODE_69_length_28801_cov_10.460038_18_plen_481_part_00